MSQLPPLSVVLSCDNFPAYRNAAIRAASTFSSPLLDVFELGGAKKDFSDKALLRDLCFLRDQGYGPGDITYDAVKIKTDAAIKHAAKDKEAYEGDCRKLFSLLEGSLSPASRLRVMAAAGAVAKFDVRDRSDPHWLWRTIADLHMTASPDKTAEGARFAAMQRTARGMRMRPSTGQQGSPVTDCITQTVDNMEINASVVNKYGDGWAPTRATARAMAIADSTRFLDSIVEAARPSPGGTKSKGGSESSLDPVAHRLRSKTPPKPPSSPPLPLATTTSASGDNNMDSGGHHSTAEDYDADVAALWLFRHTIGEKLEEAINVAFNTYEAYIMQQQAPYIGVGSPSDLVYKFLKAMSTTHGEFVTSLLNDVNNKVRSLPQTLEEVNSLHAAFIPLHGTPHEKHGQGQQRGESKTGGVYVTSSRRESGKGRDGHKKHDTSDRKDTKETRTRSSPAGASQNRSSSPKVHFDRSGERSHTSPGSATQRQEHANARDGQRGPTASSTTAPPAKKSIPTCSKCGSQGHLARHCTVAATPSKSTYVTMMDSEDDAAADAEFEDEGFVFMAGGQLKRGATVLDSASNVHLFCDAAELIDIRKLAKPLLCSGLNGELVVHSCGTHALLGRVYYSRDAPCNIISMFQVEKMGVTVEIVHHAGVGMDLTFPEVGNATTTLMFRFRDGLLQLDPHGRSPGHGPSGQLLAVTGSSKRSQAQALQGNTSADAAKSFSKRAVGQAQKARDLMIKTGVFSERDMIAAITSGRYLNIDIVPDDEPDPHDEVRVNFF